MPWPSIISTTNGSISVKHRFNCFAYYSYRFIQLLRFLLDCFFRPLRHLFQCITVRINTPSHVGELRLLVR